MRWSGVSRTYAEKEQMSPTTQRGEIDWLESPIADQVPTLAHAAGVTVEVSEPCGSIGIMRFNHLYPPFDNPAVRRALLGAVNQTDFMTVVGGPDHTLWHDRVGLFAPSSPLANEAGGEVMSGSRDYEKVKRDLAAAGYRGEKIVMPASTVGYIAILSQVGVDQLRQAGMDVEMQTMDLATLLRRVASKAPPDRGGWNVHFNILDGVHNFNPAGNTAIRGDGHRKAVNKSDIARDLIMRDLTAAELADFLSGRILAIAQPYPGAHWLRTILLIFLGRVFHEIACARASGPSRYCVQNANGVKSSLLR